MFKYRKHILLYNSNCRKLTSNVFPFLKQGQSILRTQLNPSQAISYGQDEGQFCLNMSGTSGQTVRGNGVVSTGPGLTFKVFF